MESIACIAVALIAMSGWVFYTILKNKQLKTKTDSRSRIKVEARKPHQREDHNNRLTNNTSSLFLWESPEIDEGISEIIKNRMESKLHDEQK